MKPIIDVSEFQGAIDWKKAKNEISGAVIRLGYRSYKHGAITYDKRYKSNIKGVQEAGVPYGVYFFPASVNDKEAEEEAAFIIKEAGQLDLSLPVWLDSEYAEPHGNGRADKLGRETRSHFLHKIVSMVEAAGIPCGVYSGEWWWNNNLYADRFQKIWCAKYGKNTGTPGTAPKITGASYLMWQYTSKGRISGINGYIDMNRYTEAVWTKKTAPSVFAEEGIERYTKDTSTHWISNSGSDERGLYSGGQAGDQNGKEWRLRSWYSRPWDYVLRYPDEKVRNEIASMAVKAAENDKIGYDQAQRYTYEQELKKAGYDPAKITAACEADCSSGVIANVRAVGQVLGIDALKDLNASYTGNMLAGFKEAGFTVLSDSRYTRSADHLLPGDILLNVRYHTATNITAGRLSGTVEAKVNGPNMIRTFQKWLNENYGSKLEEDGIYGPLTRKAAIMAYQRTAGGIAVDGIFGQQSKSAGYRMAVRKGMTGLRKVYILQGMLYCRGYDPKGLDGIAGQGTDASVRAFQRAKHLTVDGSAGPETWYAVFNK